VDASFDLLSSTIAAWTFRSVFSSTSTVGKKTAKNAGIQICNKLENHR
jgi:hypothetical protein